MMGIVASVLVAVVMLVAGITKIARPNEWRSDASAMGVPASVARPVPYVEVVLGAFLLVQWQRTLIAWGAVVLLLLFTGLLALRLAQGQRPRCACFGSFSASPIGPWHLARNAAFIALAVAGAVL